MKKNYQNQTALVFGLGLSGKALVPFLQERGAHVIAYDDRDLKDFTLCPVYSKVEEVPFEDVDFIAFSPGIPFSHPLFQKAIEKKIPLKGEIELGVCELTNLCIGITGTNGKTTVTSLITHILNQSNRPALALGNIGKPLTAAIENIDSNQILVLELSSYQIEALESQFLDLGLILNITPDHLDRYIHLEKYAQAKLKIQNAMKPEGYLYVGASVYENYQDQMTFPAVSILDQELELHFQQNSSALIPKPNQIAAITICRKLGLLDEEIQNGLRTFKGLPHRCEFIREINGIHFYNDSKATNLESVMLALTSLQGPLSLIMGGQDKGLDFSTLVPYLKNKVKNVYLIGEIKERLDEVLSPHCKTYICQTLEEAVDKAYQASQKNELVLLSPGSSSFDMFKNFEDRGDTFKKIVNQFKGVCS